MYKYILKTLVISSVLLTASSGYCVKPITIIEANLDDFIQRIIPYEDHQEFRLFYNELVYEQQKDKQSVKEKARKKQQEHASFLRELGKSSVAVRDPLLAEQLKPYLNNNIKNDQATEKKVTTFLFRYGAYEQYLKQKALKKNTIASKARSYLRDVGHKFTGWFNGIKLFKGTTV